LASETRGGALLGVNDSAMKKYARGYMFLRPYRWYDWALLVFVPCFGGAISFAKEPSLYQAAVVSVLVLSIQLYAFRPAYGYLNTRKRLAMDRSFKRLPFNRIRLVHDKGTLIILDVSSDSVFFAVPGITEGQFNEVSSSI
jgi:hypothetical protein